MKKNQIIGLISTVILLILLAGSMYVVKEGNTRLSSGSEKRCVRSRSPA